MLFRFTRIFIALGLLGAVWLLVTMRRAKELPPRPLPPAPPGVVKIVQFYVNTGTLAKGESALLCFGVENARKVSITPLAETVTPALARCLEISPQHTTHYTLMAEGFDGRVVTQSLTLPVSPTPIAAPQILQFAGTKQGGRAVKLCYQVSNAQQVVVEPAVVPPTEAPVGCFGVEPAQTTTYTLTAFGAQQRKASKQVIVEVVPPAR